MWEVTPNDQAKYPGIAAVSFPGHPEAAWGFQTSYDYDTLNDLTKVTQGNQFRTFNYDSLQRLTSATNPESGLITYDYDDNGNLLVKTDARNVSAHYAYDSLNRMIRRWYNGSSLRTATTNNSPALPATVGATAEANFLYDAQTLPAGAPSYTHGAAIGRLVAVTYGSGSNGDYYGFDDLGRQKLKFQQQIGTLNYQTITELNRAGQVTSLSYPSGHAVSYEYDAAGRTTNVNGNLGDSANRSYSTGIVYSSFGGVTKEQFGTDTPIFNKLYYNVRGQLAEIRESTSYTGPTDETWNRGAIINHYSDNCWGKCGGSSSTTAMTDNNGNLKKQEHFIPGATQVTFTQFYNYDSLNRLQDVSESKSINGGARSQSGVQAYTYDRFGNRTINSSLTSSFINQKQFEVDPGTNRLYAPGDLGISNLNLRQMHYDDAGNLDRDNWSRVGTSQTFTSGTYDAENRLVITDTSSYTYDGDGHRVGRTSGGIETWQVYGLGGELLAEYAENSHEDSPQKEYGYRNGQLLITATPGTSGTRTNVALAANGATASAPSQYGAGWGASAAINGDRKGAHWGSDPATGSGWNSATTGAAWLEVNFNGSQTIDEIDLFGVQDSYASPITPTQALTFSLYGLTGFDIQYWNGGAWATVPGCSVTSNNKVWRQFSFTAITTSKIRVVTNASPDGYSRVVELEAWTTTPAAPARSNVALASGGATVTASSQYDAGRGASAAINGDRKGLHWGTDAATGSGWHSATTGAAWLEVDFGGSKTIDEIDVFGPQDNYANPIDPTPDLTFSLYSLTGFEVQYLAGSIWTTVPGGSVTGNNKVWSQFTFTPVTTTKIRLLTNASPDGYSRLTEVEAWTSSSGTPQRSNFALASSGATVTASSQYDAGRGASAAINGDRKGLHWGTDAATGSGWHSATTGAAWLEVDFGGSKTIDEIDVFGPQDNYANPIDPTLSLTFSLYSLTGFDVQYLLGSTWTTVSGGSVTGNNKVWRQFTFTPVTTSKIRVLTNASPDGYSRLTEVEAWGTATSGASGSTPAEINWLVTDQLGTPRMMFDKTGSLANMKRHDYLPFGEELFAGVGSRTQLQGYSLNDGIRQQFTQKERDIETGLDYFNARYYLATQGRFVSADSFAGSRFNPQALNRYAYTGNNPLNFTDPTGHDKQEPQTQGGCTPKTPCQNVPVSEWDKHPPLIDAGTVNVRATDASNAEELVMSSDDCLYCSSLAVEMHKMAVPMAKVLETGAQIDVAIITFPLALGQLAAQPLV